MKNRTIEYINNFFSERPELIYLKDAIVKTTHIITELKPENKILVCGNGGSAADSEHIAGEFLKSFVLKRKVSQDLRNKLVSAYENGNYIADNLQQGIKCIPLTSFSAFNTAFANDCDGDFMFAQLVNSLGIANDCLIAISTSGNSKNVQTFFMF